MQRSCPTRARRPHDVLPSGLRDDGPLMGPSAPEPLAPSAPMSAAEVVFDSLLEATHLAAPHQVPALVARHAAMLGIEDAVVYLADLQQAALVPFLGSGGPSTDRQYDTLPVDSTVAGRAFQLVRVLSQDDPDRVESSSVKMWLPLVNGSERVGVLAVTVPDAADPHAPDGMLERRLRRLAAVVAELVVTKA